MQRLSLLALAPRKKGKIPGFASDTLIKVYRDAIYGSTAATRQQQQQQPTEDRPSATMRYTPWRNEKEVTNHVGEIGIMSRLAHELRERDRAMESGRDTSSGEHDHDHDHDHSHRGHTHAVPRGGSRASPAQRQATPSPPLSVPLSSSSPPSTFAWRAAPEGVLTSMGEYHGRSQRSSADPHGGKGRSAADARHSGVQREILTMYRQMLREVRRMQDAGTRKNLQAYIRGEYDKNVDVPRKNIAKIEWCLNTGKRKLEDLQCMSPTTKFSIRM